MYAIIDLNTERFISFWADEEQAERIAVFLGSNFSVGFIPTLRTMNEIASLVWED